MSIATNSVLTLFLLAFIGCAGANNFGTCLATKTDVEGLSLYSIGDELQPDRAYRVRGYIYSDFEESGFVPGPFPGWEASEDQRLSAFCVLLSRECVGALGEGRERIRGVEIIEVEAVGRYRRAHEDRDYLSQDCPRGTMEILRFISARQHFIE